jgi:Flp pilus assembly protein TadG
VKTQQSGHDNQQPFAVRARGERGAALVELAVALPLLALVLVGTIDFGRAFRTAMVVTAAARAGAMYGAYSTANSANNAGMISAANDVLNANGLSNGLSPLPSHLCHCVDDTGVFVASTPANTCTDAACPGRRLVVSVTVTVSRTFSLTNPFPGIPSSVTITRGVTARAQ